jgi:ligand-binding sensor domain-containing protein/class 3 adenylate cyclase
MIMNRILILILLTTGIALPVFAQTNGIRFTQLNIEDGLSQSTINDILQDSRGFLWFATDDGLNRYDGYDFVVYRNIPGDPTSISSNVITSIIEDFEGNIWVSTNGGGINRFNRATEKFTRFRHNPEDNRSLSNDFVTKLHQDFTGVMLVGTHSGLNIFDPRNGSFTKYSTGEMGTDALRHDYITDVLKDPEGMIWIGTQTGGLYKFDRFANSFTQFGPGTGNGMDEHWVESLYVDNNNTIWAGTQNGGLYKYDRTTSTFENFRNIPGDSNSLSNNWVLSMYEDAYGEFWVGTLNGLNIMDRETGKFTNISEQQRTYLSNYSISSLFEDKSGVFWIGTKDGALNKFVRTTESFRVFQNEPGNLNSISENNIWAVLEDKNEDVWIGTHGGGLNHINSTTGVITRYYHDPENPNSITSNFINALMQDRNGNIWIGTIDGLNKLNPVTKQFTHYRYDPFDDNTISGDIITSLLETRQGIIWIGTLNDGLTGFDPSTGEIRRFVHDANDPESLSHNKVWSMYEDSYGNFWVGTHGFGLNRYDRVNERFYRYSHRMDDPNSMSDNFVNFIHESKNGDLWIGTLNGLNKYDRVANTFKSYTTQDGLPNNVIYGLVEDSRGNLWLSTNNGIADFNPNTETVRVYDAGDGLPGNEYRFGAYFAGREGRLYFGGINGLVIFEADSIRDNPFKPPVVLTNFQIFNRPVPISEESPLKKAISEMRDMTLSYRESVFSFQFSALHYASPSQNQYAFMMDGFDNGWQYVGNRRFTSYTNLPPGEYTFRVKAANKDGVWNEEGSSINVTITPPFWKTWWAYSIYGISFFGILFGFVNNQIERERRKKKRIELQRDLLEKEVKLRTEQLAEEKEKGEKLLYNILPIDIAKELIENGKAKPRRFEEATVIFTDFKNFTHTASSMSASKLISELNEIFEAFDTLASECKVEKIKTIGDSYMAVAGVPNEDEEHALNAVRFAVKMLQYIEKRNESASVKWDMRIGIHTGNLVAGVVGKNKFTYDIWGDSVIIASRMEVNGEPGKVNISAVTYDYIRDHFECEYRGKVYADGKGNLDMYFVKRPIMKKAAGAESGSAS